MSELVAGPGPRLVLAATTDLSYDQRMQRISGNLARAGYQVLLVGWQRPASVPLTPQPYAQHRLRAGFKAASYFTWSIICGCSFSAGPARRRLGLRRPRCRPPHLAAGPPGQPALRVRCPRIIHRSARGSGPPPRAAGLAVGRKLYRAPRLAALYGGPGLARLFEQRHPGCPFSIVRNVPGSWSEVPWFLVSGS
ncbi:MAG: hypothetical protein WKG07_42250 [Hymenobacter sp.]